MRLVRAQGGEGAEPTEDEEKDEQDEAAPPPSGLPVRGACLILMKGVPGVHRRRFSRAK